MKIPINKNESYDITIPEEFESGQAFLEWVGRLHQIAKLIGKDFFGQVKRQRGVRVSEHTLSQNPRENQYSELIKSKSEAIELLRAYYSNNRDNAKAFLKNKGVTFANNTDFTDAVRYIKFKFGVTAKEVGLTRYPIGRESPELLRTK